MFSATVNWYRNIIPCSRRIELDSTDRLCTEPLESAAWNIGPSPQPTRATICPHAKMRTRAGNTATRHTRSAFFQNNTSCLARSGKLCHALLQPSTSTRAAADSPRSDAVSRLCLLRGAHGAHCDNCNSAFGGVLHLHVRGCSVSKTRSIRTQCADPALPHHAASVRGCAPGFNSRNARDWLAIYFQCLTPSTGLTVGQSHSGIAPSPSKLDDDPLNNSCLALESLDQETSDRRGLPSWSWQGCVGRA